jgi:hypothetical protein
MQLQPNCTNLLSTVEPTIGSSHAFQDLAQTPGEESTWQFLQQCISCCLRLHHKCNANYDPEWMPKRLLLLDKKDNVSARIRLIDTREHLVNQRYIALSYVWGSGPKLLATRETLAALRTGVDQAKLPATMKDCVTVAAQLDVQYIWIDALCIMQDDKDDWAVQSQQMSRVFENALFVVAACSSPNTSTPFLGLQAPSMRLNSATFRLSSLDRDLNHVRARNVECIRHSFVEGPLEGRGWTWQERKLSARSINFTSEQVIWHCKEAEFYEHGMIMNRHQSPWSMEVATRTGKDEVLYHDAWLDCMGDYSPRQLTYDTDRLPAVSGMAARFHAVRRCDYYAGLWADDFPQCLGWCLRHFLDSPAGAAPESLSALDNGIPSWSWASVRGQVTWPHLVPSCRGRNLEDPYSPRVEADSELLEVECKPATQNQFGEVSRGSFLKLRGKVVDAFMECDGFGRALVRRDGFAPQHVQPDCLLTQDSATRNHGPAEGGHGVLPALGRVDQAKSAHGPDVRIHGSVVCMLLYSIYDEDKSSAFVLVLCKASTDHAVYRRVAAGTGRFGPVYLGRQDWKQWEGWTGLEEWYHWREWFADAETRDLCIF